MNTPFHPIRSFLRDDDGAQVIEYALIIAVVSLALVLALRPLTDNNYFGNFIIRLSACLTGSNCV
jgi:pilus assembly protein Flp/PilA